MRVIVRKWVDEGRSYKAGTINFPNQAIFGQAMLRLNGGDSSSPNQEIAIISLLLI